MVSPSYDQLGVPAPNIVSEPYRIFRHKWNVFAQLHNEFAVCSVHRIACQPASLIELSAGLAETIR
jgi:hypothetical protein